MGSCQEKCIQERAVGITCEWDRRAITLVHCRHKGLPVVAEIWEEGERLQLVPDFQEDLSTSWSCHSSDQMRVCGLEVRRGLDGSGVWGNKGHGIACVDNSWTYLKAGCLDTAQGVDMQSSGCRDLKSGSVCHSTSLELTRKSPGVFVPSWRQICSHEGKFHHQENEAVAAWILLGIISRAGCGNLLLECFAVSGEAAKYSPVSILSVTCFTCCTLSEGLVASVSGKKGCSVSESVFVVSQMNQTITRRVPGDQKCWD